MPRDRGRRPPAAGPGRRRRRPATACPAAGSRGRAVPTRRVASGCPGWAGRPPVAPVGRSGGRLP
ncbi:MAG: hypothetical protein D6721_07385 [Gammaproteobacteria bacterium]|nr:MAG: hypothetical protein D6721_07385 [Gammaproteobacteria bacterium]